jgi:myo-inositol-1(or 4)-monophosphatase
MHPLLNIALKTVRAASTQLLREFDRVASYQDERQADLTKIRFYLEQDFAAALKQKYPDHTILFRPDADALATILPEATVWCVDLLNGEENYRRGLPQFALCLAIFQQGKCEHALIYDPVLNETFSGTRNQQGQFNNVRMQIAENAGKNTVYLAGNKQIDTFQTFYTGCHALMLAYTACGRYDAFVGSDLSPVEAAVGSLLIKSAGGMATDLKGGDRVLATQELAGSNLKFLKGLLQKIATQA